MKKLFQTHSNGSALAEAKTQLTIHELWKHFKYLGVPKKSCHSPFRDEARPSFSVNEAGTLWHDFGTDEGGDAVDFLQRATGLSKTEACRKFIELARGRIVLEPGIHGKQILRQPEAKPMPCFPAFGPGSAADIQQLAELRQIHGIALQWAVDRGILRFATTKGCPAWVVTDCAQVNAQARRLDGQIWDHIEAKAYTLPGSWASWPIGILEAKGSKSIALCEGGPDILAAHMLAIWEQADCAPVAMLGASHQIHAEALPLFKGKRVRIFGHDDDAGRKAVHRWADQLAKVEALVDAFRFAGLVQADGEPVVDLNDSFKMPDSSFEEIGRMLP